MSDDVSIPNSGYAGRRTGRYGRQNRAAGSDNRRLLIYAGGLGALLVAMIAASSLTSHRSGTVPVVEADPRPIRVKPDNPGGMQIDAAENDVFSGGSGTANAKLSAEAETPNPNGLQALPKPKPAALTAAAPAATSALPPAAAKPAVVAAEPPPAAKPAAAAAPAATKPTVVASAVPAISPATKAQPAHAATVQLAALTTEQAAKDEWQKLARQLPEAFAGRQPSISKVEHDGRTFWRLRTAGFADIAQARAFCDKVRTKGGGCSVADF